jgi:CRISPR-associated Csx2 family protein
MGTLLVTLGKGRRDIGNRYSRTKYRFKDGFIYETSFFGIALHHWLVKTGTILDQIVILGANGSSWDALLEEESVQPDRMETLYYELGQAAENNQVTSGLLRRIEPFVATIFQTKAHCHLIEDASSTEGQFDILNAIVETILPESELYIDITHGYRHLPP